MPDSPRPSVPDGAPTPADLARWEALASYGPFSRWEGYDDDPEAGDRLFVRVKDGQGRRHTLHGPVVAERLNGLTVLAAAYRAAVAEVERLTKENQRLKARLPWVECSQ